MEEETFFEEELTTLEEILDFRESGFSNKIQIKDFRNLHDILKDFQESPFELDSNTRVFLIDENKMNLFKTELKNLASKPWSTMSWRRCSQRRWRRNLNSLP